LGPLELKWALISQCFSFFLLLFIAPL